MTHLILEKKTLYCKWVYKLKLKYEETMKKIMLILNKIYFNLGIH